MGFPSGVSISVSYEDGHSEQFGSDFPKMSSMPGSAGGSASMGYHAGGASHTMDIDHERTHDAVPDDPTGHKNWPKVEGFERESSNTMAHNTDPDIPQEIWDCMTEKERLEYLFGNSDDEDDSEDEDNHSKKYSRPTRPLPRRRVRSH